VDVSVHPAERVGPTDDVELTDEVEAAEVETAVEVELTDEVETIDEIGLFWTGLYSYAYRLRTTAAIKTTAATARSVDVKPFFLGPFCNE
jgi:hypothetical protein